MRRIAPAQPGRRHFGVPPGGPADEESFRLALALLGSAAPVYEVALVAASFEVSEPSLVAIVGAAGKHTVRAFPGEPVHVPTPVTGCRTYVAERPLRQGEMPKRLAEAPGSLFRGPIRYVTGPEGEGASLTGNWRVTPNSDRRGIRLTGIPLPTRSEMPSSPTPVGTIQLANDGMPIVLGWDGPTIGGYPRIGVVISADLDRLGQLAPGHETTFEEVDLDTARALRDEREDRLQRLELLVAMGVKPAADLPTH